MQHLCSDSMPGTLAFATCKVHGTRIRLIVRTDCPNCQRSPHYCNTRASAYRTQR